MIVKARVTSGAGLPASTREHYTVATVFDVSVGRCYPAHGLLMFQGGIFVLVNDDTGRPNWYPLEVFEVADGRLPESWKFATRDEGEFGSQAILGYPELVDDKGHKDALIERDPQALRIFYDRSAK